MKKLFGYYLLLLLNLTLLSAPTMAADKIYVVTTTSDLAYFAEQVGGDRVKVDHLIEGYRDPHFIDARPDYILKASRADVYCEIGLDLEVGWSPVVIKQSRNSKIQTGAPGYCDASEGVHVKQVPTVKVNRSMGDMHVFGNPHYHPDPLNAAIAARNIRDALIRVDPDGKDTYNFNYKNLVERLKDFTIEQIRGFKRYTGIRVAVHHREFVYLADLFGFEIALSLEEKPGVPPSATYMKEVIDRMKNENIKIILIAPWNDPSYAETVAKHTGARVVIMPLSVGSIPEAKTYEDSVRLMLSRIKSAVDGK